MVPPNGMEKLGRVLNSKRDPIALEKHISEVEARSKDGDGGTELWQE